MIVVCDSTPLIYLAAIGKFDLLRTIYNQVSIPSAVYDEVVTQGAGRWGAAETAHANWITRHVIADSAQVTGLKNHLNDGESEAIVLAGEIHADLVVMDESAGRRELSARGIAFVGTVGILILAKQRGEIATVKPELDRLRSCGFHLSESLYQAVLLCVSE
jgi:predicted nucleic acid-binding protein